MTVAAAASCSTWAGKLTRWHGGTVVKGCLYVTVVLPVCSVTICVHSTSRVHAMMSLAAVVAA